MTQIAIQEMIVAEVWVNTCAHLRKGQTIKARQAKSKAYWLEILMTRGYAQREAEQIWQDAYDVAILELNAV